MLVLGPTIEDLLDANSVEFVGSGVCSLGPSGIEKLLGALAPRMTSAADQRPELEGLSPFVFWIHLQTNGV